MLAMSLFKTSFTICCYASGLVSAAPALPSNHASTVSDFTSSIAVRSPKTLPTVYLAGDSTMAHGGGGTGTEGWGEYLKYSLPSLEVKNYAVAGTSARSYTTRDLFANISESVQSGDWVVVEFGHNDATSSPDDGTSDCVGTGDEVCHFVYEGVNRTVYTYNHYISAVAANLTSRGAHVVISSQTPDNPEETGTFVYAPTRFVTYASLTANATRNPYIDHNAYTYAAYKAMNSSSAVDALFPVGHTHTSPEGADIVHRAFVRGLLCGTNELRGFVVNKTSEVGGQCL